MNKKSLKKLAESEAEIIEREFRSKYNTRMGIKNMITQGLLRFIKLINNQNKSKDILVLEGYAQAITGNELWINTDGETTILYIKDKDTRWNLYCNYLKITIEVINKDEINAIGTPSP